MIESDHNLQLVMQSTRNDSDSVGIHRKASESIGKYQNTSEINRSLSETVGIGRKSIGIDRNYPKTVGANRKLAAFR